MINYRSAARTCLHWFEEFALEQWTETHDPKIEYTDDKLFIQACETMGGVRITCEEWTFNLMEQRVGETDALLIALQVRNLLEGN